MLPESDVLKLDVARLASDVVGVFSWGFEDPGSLAGLPVQFTVWRRVVLICELAPNSTFVFGDFPHVAGGWIFLGFNNNILPAVSLKRISMVSSERVKAGLNLVSFCKDCVVLEEREKVGLSCGGS